MNRSRFNTTRFNNTGITGITIIIYPHSILIIAKFEYGLQVYNIPQYDITINTDSQYHTTIGE